MHATGMDKDSQKDGVTPGTGASRPLPAPGSKRGNGLVVFAIVFATIAMVIGAVLLFANDARNYRRMIAYLHLEHLLETPEPATRAPSSVKSNRLKPAIMRLPLRILDTPQTDVAGTFLREMRDLGPEVCKAFDKIGIENSGWQQSAMDRKSFECLSEDAPVPPDPGPDANGEEAPVETEPSLFFIAKGDPDGEIRSIRIKLVLTGSEKDEAVRKRLMGALSLLKEQTSWSDLSQFIDSIEALKPLTTQHSGMSYSFKPEFTDPNRYNLIVMNTAKDPLVRRARAYFDRATWLPKAPPVEPRWPFVSATGDNARDNQP